MEESATTTSNSATDWLKRCGIPKGVSRSPPDQGGTNFDWWGPRWVVKVTEGGGGVAADGWNVMVSHKEKHVALMFIENKPKQRSTEICVFHRSI